jgi:hypothetical protein
MQGALVDDQFIAFPESQFEMIQNRFDAKQLPKGGTKHKAGDACAEATPAFAIYILLIDLETAH